MTQSHNYVWLHDNCLRIISIDIMICDIQDGATPLFIASQEGHAAVVEVLACRGANVDQPDKVSLILNLQLSIKILCVRKRDVTRSASPPVQKALFLCKTGLTLHLVAH